MLLSAEAQTALLVNGFRRPSRSDNEVSKYLALPELADVEVFAVDEAAAANEREPFLEMISSVAGAAQ